MTPIQKIDHELESNSALRFIYMDDDELLSPTTSFHDSANFSMKGVGDWNYTTTTPQSPSTVDSRQSEILPRHAAHNDFYTYNQHQNEPPERRKSIRKSISHAFTSSFRVAKDAIQLPNISPIKTSKTSSKSKHNQKWRKQLNLPPGVNEDEAIAVLLARELSMLDL